MPTDYTYDKPKHGYKSENHARRWAKNRKLKVKCVEYVKGGARVQVANKKHCMTLKVVNLAPFEAYMRDEPR